MVSRGADSFVLWPHYFDRSRTVVSGRRVPKELAVLKPTWEWVRSAAKKANLEIVSEDEKARHPSEPWKASGRILVKKNGPKQAMLRAVATKLAESK